MTRIIGWMAAVAVVALAGGACAFAKEGEGGPATTTVSGEITKIEGSTLSIGIKREGQTTSTQTVTVNEKTEIAMEVALKAADLKAGQKVRVATAGRSISGEVVKVEGSTLTLAIKQEGGSRQETIDLGTATVSARGAGKLEDLKVGMRISARVASGAAVRIEVIPAQPPRAGGEGERRRDGEAPKPRTGEGERRREGAEAPAPPRREGAER